MSLKNRVGSTLGTLLLLLALLPLNLSAADLDTRVEIALGQDEENHSLRARLAAVHALPKDLGGEHAEALFKGIILPPKAVDLRASEWAALYNDVLNKLNALNEPLPDYAKRLTTCIAQEERDVVLRDYALQLLLNYAQFKMEAETREELFKELTEVVGTAPETTLPGTYLLGIWQKAGEPGYPEAETIAGEALKLASNPDVFTPNRISGIQICGQLGHEPALETSVSIARDGTLPTALRAASLATIGILGDESQLTLLRKIKYAGTSNQRIILAADAAMSKLQ